MAHPEFYVDRPVQLCKYYTLSSGVYGAACSEFRSYRCGPCVSRQAKCDGRYTRVQCPARHDGGHEYVPYFRYTANAGRVGTDAESTYYSFGSTHVILLSLNSKSIFKC